MINSHILYLLVASSLATCDLVLPSFGILPEVTIAAITPGAAAPSAAPTRSDALVFPSFGIIPALSVEFVTTPAATPSSQPASPSITLPDITTATNTPTGTLSSINVLTSSLVLAGPSTSTRLPASVSATIPTKSLGAALVSSPLLSPATTSLPPSPTKKKKKKKGPFAPPGAVFGGIPDKSLDVPLTCVFLVLFIAGAITHFRIHGANGKRKHKFHLSVLMFDFCMIRNITCILRIVWAFTPTNASVELAAIIFEFAGVVVVFLVNVFFTQRITRAFHGNFGYHAALNVLFKALTVSVPAIIVHNILISVLSSYTLNLSTIKILHDFQLFGSAYIVFLAALPIPFLLFATWIPGSQPLEKFGTGRFRNKVAILLYSSGSLTIGAAIRFVAAYIERPKFNAGWFNSKGTFYLTTFTAEIVVVYLYIFLRVDKRFHVPDGASKAGDYAKEYPQHGKMDVRRNSDDEMGFARDASGVFGFEIDEKYRNAYAANGPARSLGEVKSALRSIKLSPNIQSYPVDMGDDKVCYVFKRNEAPMRPLRSTTALVPLEAGLSASGALQPASNVAPKRPPRSTTTLVPLEEGLSASGVLLPTRNVAPQRPLRSKNSLVPLGVGLSTSGALQPTSELPPKPLVPPIPPVPGAVRQPSEWPSIQR